MTVSKTNLPEIRFKWSILIPFFFFFFSRSKSLTLDNLFGAGIRARKCGCDGKRSRSSQTSLLLSFQNSQTVTLMTIFKNPTRFVHSVDRYHLARPAREILFRANSQGGTP